MRGAYPYNITLLGSLPKKGKGLPIAIGIKNKPPGNDLFSQPLSRPVSSALRRFTTVFGMGTGGSTSLVSPRDLHAMTMLKGTLLRPWFDKFTTNGREKERAYPGPIVEKASADEERSAESLAGLTPSPSEPVVYRWPYQLMLWEV